MLGQWEYVFLDQTAPKGVYCFGPVWYVAFKCGKQGITVQYIIVEYNMEGNIKLAIFLPY